MESRGNGTSKPTKQKSSHRCRKLAVTWEKVGWVVWEVGIDIYTHITNKDLLRASQVAQVVKNPPANTGDARGVGSIPGSGRFP